MKKKLIVIEVAALGGEYFEVRTCDEDKVQSTLELMIDHSEGIDTDNLYEDDETGEMDFDDCQVRKVMVYSITDEEEVCPNDIIKKIYKRREAARKKYAEDSDVSEFNRLKKKLGK